MINISDIENKVQNIQKENKNIMIKNMPQELLIKFHKLFGECLKELDIVVKGSRALNKFFKNQIYSDEELFYVDYDIYSCNYKSDLEYIANYFEKHNMKFIKIRVLPFKCDITRILLYKVPIVDIEDIDIKYYNQLKYKTFNGIKYIHPEFYKIDLYSILAQPILINMKVFQKAIDRLSLVESKYKYKSKYKFKTSTLSDTQKYILSLVKKNSIVIGDYAYNKLYNKKIKIDYLEILTEDIYYYINKLKKKFPNIKYNKYKKFMYIMSNYIVVFKDNNPILILWCLKNTTTYKMIDNIKYCSEYYLKFYYNFLTYFNCINAVFKNSDYYLGLLKKIKIKELPELTSYGNINIDAKEQYINIKTHKTCSFFEYDS